MSVYVDNMRAKFGRMVMCHMIADHPAELRAMAERIGVKLKWFQNSASVPHFDVCMAKRDLAVQSGAIELERRLFVEISRRVRATWPRFDGKWLLP